MSEVNDGVDSIPFVHFVVNQLVLVLNELQSCLILLLFCFLLRTTVLVDRWFAKHCLTGHFHWRKEEPPDLVSSKELLLKQ